MAIERLQELINSRPSPDADDIYAITCAEIEKGQAAPLRSRESLDSEFGRGRCTFMKRFLVHQASGKDRGIDDGRRGGQNAVTKLIETIFTTSTDWPPQGAACLVDAWREDAGLDPPVNLDDGPLPLDVAPVLSTDDVPDAYRECPVRPQDRAACFIAVWMAHLGGWGFTEQYGMAFGLASAVLNFNRWPTLLVAAARRLGAVICAAYFDDIAVLDPGAVAPSGRKFNTELCHRTWWT